MEIGPSLPPGFLKAASSEEDEATIGPKLPPQLEKETQPSDDFAEPHGPRSKSDAYGPALPPSFRSEGICSEEEEEEEDEEDIIGPMPCSGEITEEEHLRRIRRDVEARSQHMKEKLSGKADKAAAPKREEWMTELPVEFKPLGIGARKFRTNVQDSGDRSVWTDTPMDRLRKKEEGGETKKEKKEEKKTATLASVVTRDKALAEQVEKYNREHRSESLVDMHRRKRKAEETEKRGTPQERRPFDRERDLEAPRNLVSPAKRAALTKDSKMSLDNRFQRGSHSFL